VLEEGDGDGDERLPRAEDARARPRSVRNGGLSFVRPESTRQPYRFVHDEHAAPTDYELSAGEHASSLLRTEVLDDLATRAAFIPAPSGFARSPSAMPDRLGSRAK